MAARARGQLKRIRARQRAARTCGTQPGGTEVCGRGWVPRSADPDNARYTLATLTDAGWSTVVATAPGHVEAVRRYVFDALTPAQVRQLSEIGRRVRRAINPEGDSRLPGAYPLSDRG